MFFHIVPLAVRPPTVCALCGGTRGPFVDVTGLEHLEIATIHGVRHYDGAVYICVGNKEQTGCLLQMADAVGCRMPEDAREDRQLVEAYRQRNEELTAQVAELERRELRVVSVEELQTS